MRLVFLLLLLLLFVKCTTSRVTRPLSLQSDPAKVEGTDPILLEEFHKQNKLKNPKKDIIVAVLDTRIDIDHEDLKGQIWTNNKEIPNNKIDDDHNGYIDDVKGWNFLGTKSGNYIVWTNHEYIRIIRKYDAAFKGKKPEEITAADLPHFKQYEYAIQHYDYYRSFYAYWLKSMQYSEGVFQLSKDTLRHFFPKEDYNRAKLDSLYKIYDQKKNYSDMRETDDRNVDALIFVMIACMESKITSLAEITDKKNELDSILNKSLNLEYNEREFIGDNEEVLEKGYGNNTNAREIEGIRSVNGHSTKVSGLIAANRENGIGINGFSNRIKIMPLTVVCSGDEHDKDIAMAIYYAVDHGAKIINMSFAKSFSLHKAWVSDAIKYAESRNVLLVHAAGNESKNVDERAAYPTDYDFETKSEFAANFINVGSVSSRIDSTFVSSYSNYGKKNLDLFAPGEAIYTTVPDSKYDFDSGTSLAAPMVSGTAALIWLYYPKLTVGEVKQIILESGTSYTMEVLIPGGEGKKAPFQDLSKSGKVLNVYEAMKMAKTINSKK